MDKVIRVCTGGPVSQTGSGADFGSMEVIVLVFQTLLMRIKLTFGCDELGVIVGMQARYDAGLMPISSNDDWYMYKEVVLASQIRSLEVVVERIIVGVDL